MNTDALLKGQILSIDKPASWTSFDVVKKIRSLTGIKKVGHAGTLDPFATGLLLVCTGAATKTISNLMGMPKEYITVVEFGYETDTMDWTGKNVREAGVPKLSKERIIPILDEFKGKIVQEVPAYSAAKYKGKRLYKLARKGEETPKLFKEVIIYDLELLELTETSMKVRVECGSGTYIRALGKDIARKLESAGHLKSLVRTRIGDYALKDAWTIERLEEELKQNVVKVK